MLQLCLLWLLLYLQAPGRWQQLPLVLQLLQPSLQRTQPFHRPVRSQGCDCQIIGIYLRVKGALPCVSDAAACPDFCCLVRLEPQTDPKFRCISGNGLMAVSSVRVVLSGMKGAGLQGTKRPAVRMSIVYESSILQDALATARSAFSINPRRFEYDVGHCPSSRSRTRNKREAA